MVSRIAAINTINATGYVADALCASCLLCGEILAAKQLAIFNSRGTILLHYFDGEICNTMALAVAETVMEKERKYILRSNIIRQ